MRIYDLIAKKRDGGTHTREELEAIVKFQWQACQDPLLSDDVQCFRVRVQPWKALSMHFPYSS